MKLKLLTLFCALSLVAFGSGVRAEETKSPQGSTITVAEEGKKEEEKAPGFGCPCGSGATNTCGDTIKNSFLQYFCPVVQLANPDCGTFCGNIKSGAITPIATVESCMNYISSNAGGMPIKTFAGVACNVLCSGSTSICQTCSSPKTRAVCGLLCCPISPGDVTNCMSNNNDSCSNYLAGKASAHIKEKAL